MKPMTTEEYYTPPSEEIFEDIKAAAIKLWQTFDDDHGYATGKVNRIKDIGNVRDNWAYMIAMFDAHNQNRLLTMVKREDTHELVERVLTWSRGATVAAVIHDWMNS